MSDTTLSRLGAAEIAGLIRSDIKESRLNRHDRLQPERQLANEYGVARGTIREALNHLVNEGMVEIRPGSGTYVTYDQEEETHSVMSAARPLELIDARFALEPHICRLAVLHARKNDLDDMEALLDQMEHSTKDWQNFSDADTEFHRRLALSTGNSLLIWMVGQITSVRSQAEWTSMRQITLNNDTIIRYNRQHRQILTAISNREPERAAVYMKDHLETARLSLTRSAAT